MGGSQYAAARQARVAIAAHRERLRGHKEIRSMLRRLPEAMREEMFAIQQAAGEEILARQRADVPTRTGALQGGLSMRVSKVTLRLRVGLLGRGARMRPLFYGRIVEFGRKAQTVIASRKGAHNSVGGRIYGRRERAIRAGIRGVYRMRVGALAPRPFVRSEQAWTIRNSVGGRLGTFWEGVMRRVASGGSDA